MIPSKGWREFIRHQFIFKQAARPWYNMVWALSGPLTTGEGVMVIRKKAEIGFSHFAVPCLWSGWLQRPLQQSQRQRCVGAGKPIGNSLLRRVRNRDYQHTIQESQFRIPEHCSVVAEAETSELGKWPQNCYSWAKERGATEIEEGSASAFTTCHSPGLSSFKDYAAAKKECLFAIVAMVMPSSCYMRTLSLEWFFGEEAFRFYCNRLKLDPKQS